MFAKGVILVEGDAEEALLSGFASAIGVNLDQKGISVCNVAGTNFTPYIKLVASLGLPFAVITDWDPLDGSKPPLGKARTLGIWDAFCEVTSAKPLDIATRKEWEALSFEEFKNGWSNAGIFLNDQTFEVAVANTPGLQKALLEVLNEQGFGSIRTKRIAEWSSGQPVNSEQLLAMVADIGKGRLSTKLSKKAKGLTPPNYISDAIKYVTARA